MNTFKILRIFEHIVTIKGKEREIWNMENINLYYVYEQYLHLCLPENYIFVPNKYTH